MEGTGPTTDATTTGTRLPAIAYATPATRSSGFSVRRFFLWSVFVLGWAAAATVGGSLGMGVLGGLFLQGKVGPLSSDDDFFWGLGAVLGLAAALTFCWLSRRRRWVHVLTALLAVASLSWACVVLAGVLGEQPRKWLWEVAALIVAIWAGASVAAILASIAGWRLSRKPRVA